MEAYDEVQEDSNLDSKTTEGVDTPVAAAQRQETGDIPVENEQRARKENARWSGSVKSKRSPNVERFYSAENTTPSPRDAKCVPVYPPAVEEDAGKVALTGTTERKAIPTKKEGYSNEMDGERSSAGAPPVANTSEGDTRYDKRSRRDGQSRKNFSRNEARREERDKERYPKREIKCLVEFGSRRRTIYLTKSTAECLFDTVQADSLLSKHYSPQTEVIEVYDKTFSDFVECDSRTVLYYGSWLRIRKQKNKCLMEVDDRKIVIHLTEYTTECLINTIQADSILAKHYSPQTDVIEVYDETFSDYVECDNHTVLHHGSRLRIRKGVMAIRNLQENVPRSGEASPLSNCIYDQKRTGEGASGEIQHSRSGGE